LDIEASQLDTPSMYPNPATGLVVVQGLKPVGSLALMDLLGQVVRTQDISGERQEFRLDGIAPGVYILSNGRDWTRRLTVQR
jgi:hypothetical protein